MTDYKNLVLEWWPDVYALVVGNLKWVIRDPVGATGKSNLSAFCEDEPSVWKSAYERMGE